MAGSFVNERSVEYILARSISDTLATVGMRAIPVFFWKTREGGRLAAEGMRGQVVRVLSVFARRPKEPNARDKSVLMKVNASLFAAADVANSLGSPLLLGIPIAGSLPEFTTQTPCGWFELQGGHGLHEDVELRVVADSTCSKSPLIKRLSAEMLIDVISLAGEMDWEGAVHAMSAIRDAALPPSHSRFGPPGYRPFFLIVPSSSVG